MNETLKYMEKLENGEYAKEFASKFYKNTELEVIYIINKKRRGEN